MSKRHVAEASNAQHFLTLEAVLDGFVTALGRRNRTKAMIGAYTTDLTQFLTRLHETNVIVKAPADVSRADIKEYLLHLALRGLTGTTRVRKLSALQEFFNFLLNHGYVTSSPIASVASPKRERMSRNFLRPLEYTKLLSLSGGNPRDYAILQVLLQTGVRVSELCRLQLCDVDFDRRKLRVRMDNGRTDRAIELEKKCIQALGIWLAIRPRVGDEHLFLNRDGRPLGERGVRKLIAGYKVRAGITKKVSPHSFRHTFAAYKARHGVSAFQIQQWLGHANLSTTQLYLQTARKNAQELMEATSLEPE